MPIKTIKEKPPEAREEKALEESLAEGEIIYRSVRQDGKYTLQQTTSALAWSGVAAGISMGFSMIAEALLEEHLPQAAWAPVITKLGYAAGFIIVILGRQELFTEQTLSVVLPLLSRDDDEDGTLGNVARVWIVILVANMVGAAAFAAVTAWSGAFPPETAHAFSTIGQADLSHGFYVTLVRALYAGFLIATMIWLMPSSGSARVLVIVVIAYLVGLGAFSHIVAGASPTLYVVFRGERPILDWLIAFFIPTFIGNSVGGVALVAALAHVQHAPDESR
jgi:formate/nitrite transporter FocA (FNT family)